MAIRLSTTVRRVIASRAFESEAETATVVVAQVLVVVRLLGQLDVLAAEHFAKQLEVNRLIVNEHAIEVENDGANHGERVASGFKLSGCFGCSLRWLPGRVRRYGCGCSRQAAG